MLSWHKHFSIKVIVSLLGIALTPTAEKPMMTELVFFPTQKGFTNAKRIIAKIIFCEEKTTRRTSNFSGCIFRSFAYFSDPPKYINEKCQL